jgi:pyrroloquinoline quinone (PQQ) biosynthesis protein C
MEHFKSPFETSDFAGARTIDNARFFEGMLERARGHRFFSHPFLSTPHTSAAPPELVAFILTSFYKIVSPFTGLLCALGGRAPNLRCRFALMDNIYEEMGCGDLEAAHPKLYLRMLASIGVSAEAAESAPTLPPIRRINEHLHRTVTERDFSVACAFLASAEATIPPSFPVLATMARRAFAGVDMDFFERHGPRDEGHSDDASMLFALSADSSQFAAVEAAVKRDLDYRSELFDDWMTALARGRASAVPPRLSERPARPMSVRPVTEHHSVPPPA